MENILNETICRYPVLCSISDTILDAYYILEKSFVNGGKLLLAGNGGSASDCEHISSELMKEFKNKRPITDDLKNKLSLIDSERGKKLANCLETPLAAIPLVSNMSLATAYMNDKEADGIFAQQLLGYGNKGDVFLGISTSGNSENVINAAILAKALEIKVIGFTGQDGGILSGFCDVCVKIPAKETYLVQELQLPVYHSWCLMLEHKFFK